MINAFAGFEWVVLAFGLSLVIAVLLLLEKHQSRKKETGLEQDSNQLPKLIAETQVMQPLPTNFPTPKPKPKEPTYVYIVYENFYYGGKKILGVFAKDNYKGAERCREDAEHEAYQNEQDDREFDITEVRVEEKQP